MTTHSVFSSIIIWVWIVTFTIGVGVAGRALYDALADYFFLQGLGLNGIMKIEARKGIRTEIGRIIVALFFLLLGVLSLFTPEDLNRNVSLYEQAISVAFVLIGIVITTQSVLDRRDRTKQMAIRGIPTRPKDPDISQA